MKDNYICRMISVRGLCEASMFDRSYFYNIGENGQAMYFGELSSIVIYDAVSTYNQEGRGHWTVNYTCTQTFINTFFH